MKLKLITLLPILLCGIVAYAQHIDVQKLDSLVSHIESHDRGIGSVSVFSDGKEIYSRSFGQTKIMDASYNAETKYQIGSITKTVTAALIFKLVENNRLSLDEKLAEFYPQMPNADKITIRNLLEHSSGLRDFVVRNDSTILWLDEKVNEEDIFEEIINQGVAFQPNEKVQYSNSGYYLLTKIAEKLYAKSYASIVEDEIAKPLGLEHFVSKTEDTKNTFDSYEHIQSWQKMKDFEFSNVIGVGDIAATMRDLNTFLLNLLNGNIVKKEYVEQMKPQRSEQFGRGLVVLPFYDHIFYGHTGGTYGTHSVVGYNEKDKLGFAISMNGIRFSRNEFNIGILSIAYGKNYEFPNFDLIELTSEDLDQLLGTYSTPTFPLKLTITKEGNTLKGQGTGQPAFPLECYETNKFKFDQAGLKIEFFPEENKMLLKQGGQTFEMKKE